MMTGSGCFTRMVIAAHCSAACPKIPAGIWAWAWQVVIFGLVTLVRGVQGRLRGRGQVGGVEKAEPGILPGQCSERCNPGCAT
jgi:hypothetical protein